MFSMLQMHCFYNQIPVPLIHHQQFQIRYNPGINIPNIIPGAFCDDTKIIRVLTQSIRQLNLSFSSRSSVLQNLEDFRGKHIASHGSNVDGASSGLGFSMMFWIW